jgi:hypothetical protein
VQHPTHPAQAGRAELVAAAADGHLQRRVEADVTLLPSHAGRRRCPAEGCTWDTISDSSEDQQKSCRSAARLLRSLPWCCSSCRQSQSQQADATADCSALQCLCGSTTVDTWTWHLRPCFPKHMPLQIRIPRSEGRNSGPGEAGRGAADQELHRGAAGGQLRHHHIVAVAFVAVLPLQHRLVHSSCRG